ncbi:MAG: glycine oxidase ThiO [Candidatus Eremiobacteraeota bacterium]|nr:glycine oxidase ThiO [Candidatus Eremiobacteraeota bacterium]
MAANGAGGDVVIAGAGLIGLAVAFELAQRGAAVRVYDRIEPGRAASWAGAGMLAPFSENDGDDPLRELGAQSLASYPDFVERVRACGGIDARLHLDGIVHAAFDDAAMERWAARRAALESLGIACDLLDRREALAAEPWLGSGVRGAFVVRGEGHVDNRRLGRALTSACEALGVTIARAANLRIECDARRVLGVRSDDGFVPAAAVINACGAWAARLEGIPASDAPPVVPIKGQMLALEMPLGFVKRTTWVPGAYVVPRDDGRLLVGATVEEGGFDTRVTAAGIEQLLRAALASAPALGSFTVSETWAGLRPGSPDGRPILGQTRTPGLFVATGHYRNGILLAPATACVLADAVTTGALPPPAFAPARFETEAVAAARRELP